jgi:hypothetical protein
VLLILPSFGPDTTKASFCWPVSAAYGAQNFAHFLLFELNILHMSANSGEPKSDIPPGLFHFSPEPTVSEISKARVFDEPLIPVGGLPESSDNKALAAALTAYSCRTKQDDFSSLSGFLTRFPDSAWSASLLLHLGTEYYNYGYRTRAVDAWEQA